MENRMESQINYMEKNLNKVKIEGNVISIGEGQASYQDVFTIYLLGPTDRSRTVDVFREIENSKNYEVASGGYLSCAEITGNFDINKKFLIHSLDAVNFKNHIAKILNLAEETIPERILIKADPSRADIESYRQVIKNMFDSRIEVEIENL